MTEALFSMHADRGQIKRTDRGHYKLILNNVDKSNTWFTDRPDRLQGSISPKEIVGGWESYFSDAAPNSIVSYKTDSGRFNTIAFEQMQPKLNDKGRSITSRIKMLPTAAPNSVDGQKAGELNQDSLTGFKLQKGHSISIVDPSVVVDGYDLSQITFINASQERLQIDYVLGDFVQGAVLTTRSLEPGTTAAIAGSASGPWDISADVKVWDKVAWKTGLIAQADNPWIGHPRLGFNNSGSYHTSDTTFDGSWYQGDASEQWLLQSPSPQLVYAFSNDNPNDGDLNKDWTIWIGDQWPSHFPP